MPAIDTVSAKTLELVLKLDDQMKRIDDAFTAPQEKAGVPESVIDVLYALRTRGDGLTQREICDASFSGKQTVNYAVKKLEEDGVVHLEPGGGRKKLVSLTKKGSHLAGRISDPVIEAECRAIEALGADEAELLATLLGRYADALAREVAALGEG